MKLLVSGTILALAASAHAGFSTVGSNAYEPSHEQILESLYGGDFTASGNDFSNGTVTATRVDDADDEVFASGLSLDPVAGYAALDSTITQNADGTLKLTNSVGRSFESDDAPDQFVTYLLSGASGVSQLVFGEDSQGGDYDYNDVVVEVEGANVPPPIAIPLPAAAWAGLVGLGFAGMVARRRRTA